jgi:hypothetical protein
MDNKKIILHLCADIGSDSYPYQLDSNYKVIKIGKKIGVENYHPPKNVHGIIANPVCTEFSFAKYLWAQDEEKGMFLVQHCQRIIKEANPVWWAIANPATGKLKDYIGYPDYIYQPWEFGSPWTKRTALWGKFNKPIKKYSHWDQVKQNKDLYVRPKRPKCSLAFLHKSAIQFIDEFQPFVKEVKSDNCFRSLCSQGFAEEFKKVNP